MAEDATAERSASQGARFALTKFRPPTPPATLVTRSMLHKRLTAGAGQRLTVVVGSAGTGKSVLLSSWAAIRPPGATCWLSCDRADANPVRFWTGFIQAPRAVEPGFGADAADLLALDSVMSADVTASIANDAAKLPAGSAIIVDDFHYAANTVARDMTDLVECWPAETVQLVLASRSGPPLRLQRLRLAGELCELRDRDLYFSLAESGNMLTNFGVEIGAAELALLHQRSEGWAAALQMAALSLRATLDPVRAARALEVRSHAIAEYFISEVLDQQPPEVAWFMLDTSVLGELTADACAAVTTRQNASALLRRIDEGNLFLAALDDERTSFRYHHLVRELLRAELRARDRGREQALQLRAAEWFESTGDTRRAARHFLAAQQVHRALTLLQDRVIMRSFRRFQLGQADQAVREALAARAIQEEMQVTDEWTTALPLALVHAYQWLEDYEAVEREAAAALAMPGLTEPVELVLVPGARALAWFESGHLAEAGDAARAADVQARRLGFDQHFFALDYLRVLSGIALERRDLSTAERLTEQALSISERRRPAFEFLALLDRAVIWAARGQVRDALATVEAARVVLAGSGSVLLLQADELEALLRLSLGDLCSVRELASGLPAARRGLLLVRVALAVGDHHAAQEYLQSPRLCELTLRRALVRQLLLAAAAIGRGDPMTASIMGGALETARHGHFFNTVVTTAPQVTSYLVEHSVQMRPDPFAEQLIAAALDMRATQPEAFRSGRALTQPLTAAEMRILKLVPTSTYLQMAATLYISRNTVKTRLQSVYRKLGVTSRSQAIERAVDLRLL